MNKVRINVCIANSLEEVKFIIIHVLYLYNYLTFTVPLTPSNQANKEEVSSHTASHASCPVPTNQTAKPTRKAATERITATTIFILTCATALSTSCLSIFVFARIFAN